MKPFLLPLGGLALGLVVGALASPLRYQFASHSTRDSVSAFRFDRLTGRAFVMERPTGLYQAAGSWRPVSEP